MTTWQELPGEVRDFVRGHVGPVSSAVEITNGRSSDLAAVLDTAAGRVFVKGVEGVSRRMRHLRNEITTSTLAGDLAPAVLFAEDIGEWLVVGFEYLTGRPAGLSPGSVDLPVVADVVNRIGARPGDDTRPLRKRFGANDWWGRLDADAPELIEGWDLADAARWSAAFPTLIDGDRLVHTDLHGDQIIIGDGPARVIDWAFPGAGAAWVDPAFIVLRLIEAGHEPADAEQWARTHLKGLQGTDDAHLTAFAVYLAGMWTHWTITRTGPGLHHRAGLARDYAAWRLAQESEASEN
ncbi:hypothetical protein GCM10027271_16410 [Saccharopolyspora gloriosae]|uniref:Phosphotransferase family enzyme n=1 Tax=Saccharopolyspora gloriosae TaxID=455344 RepID=A0A840ND92_9PSEU|nr:hypothetical protein [Saccharopolyspora gloriosae]